MRRVKGRLFPSIEAILVEMGENIRFARLRRKLSQEMIALRAGIARNTLRAIEKGDQNVSMGSYMSVLMCLGLEKDMKLIARDDVLGRKLQDAGLPVKARASRRRSVKKEDGGKHKT